MAQKIYCPICNKQLIKNDDLVINDKIVFDLDKIKGTTKPIKRIVCDNCKRRLKYFIDD